MKLGISEIIDSIDTKPVVPVRVPVVQFNNVSKSFDGHVIVKDINFTIEDLPQKGEFISILGPSGCGKSTVLRLIAGLTPHHPPTTGSVLVLGTPITKPGADRGMVFQDYTSLDNRTVLENITFGLECLNISRKERLDIGRSWIEKIGLNVSKDSSKFPHELSGGMKQRVAIARTLILRPRIILMDEPFGALDPVIRLNMLDLLKELWHEVRATVFFITHHISDAVFLGDRAFIFSGSPGTIVSELKIEPATKPAEETRKEAGFKEVVDYLEDKIVQLGKNCVKIC